MRVLLRVPRGRLDGWCEGGLGQQKDDSRDWARMHECSEGVESPGAYIDDWVKSRALVCVVPVFFRPTSLTLVAYLLLRL